MQSIFENPWFWASVLIAALIGEYVPEVILPGGF